MFDCAAPLYQGETCTGVLDTCCYGTCKALNSPLSCGSCDVYCPSIGGTGTCVGGLCDVDCPAGFSKCRGDCYYEGVYYNNAKYCVNQSSDVRNCGGCGLQCPYDSDVRPQTIGGRLMKCMMT